ncbi:MAG: HAMP domain-containing histidine kinase, partial [Bacteroidota bacterium]|nr:HAMP domain-containing histidine kinase [Bacteroidota bacterium]
INSFHVFIVDSSANKVLLNVDGKLAFLPAASKLGNLKGNKPLYSIHGDVQIISIRIWEPQPCYVVTYGYDRFGMARVKTMRQILTMVALVGMVFIICFAIIIVNLITKPFIRIGLQMQRITETSLEERIKIKSRKFNHEEAKIAAHFNAMLDRLERAFELQKSFVHHASHELRTPLATMLAQTELALKKNLTGEEAKKVFLSLKEDQEEMVELTNSLLLLSQYERTNTSPEWPVLRLDELLYETMGMVKRMLPNVNVSLEFAQMPDNELFLSIKGNDSLIRSAFRNLIKNAWLYSENKSVAITIDSDSNNIYLHFDNNGKLLTLEEKERLFIPFFRASNSTQRKGFGLGLNIIQRIVTLHKGSIGYIIHNNLNRFTLQFPKLQGAALEL